jgi:hypothetical protein
MSTWEPLAETPTPEGPAGDGSRDAERPKCSSNLCVAEPAVRIGLTVACSPDKGRVFWVRSAPAVTDLARRSKGGAFSRRPRGLGQYALPGVSGWRSRSG